MDELVAGPLDPKTDVRYRAGAGAAVGIARKFLASRRYQVVFSDPQLVEAALDWMERFADKRLSLTDCSSFELMTRLGLSRSFTFDRDFGDCGFEMIPCSTVPNTVRAESEIGVMDS